jgi:ATP-binding cassette subfamily D (ALD) long-chain fatty acid import protein
LVHDAKVDIKSRGTVTESTEGIKFVNADIISPNGNELLKNLSFEVKLGQHVFINGPNGCGKSSLFRVLAGLWPLFNGAMDKPAYGDIFYIAQTSYSPKGNFRDQLIYPDTPDAMKLKGKTEKDLERILHSVYMTDVLNREQWDNVKDWKNVLSGGEK